MTLHHSVQNLGAIWARRVGHLGTWQ